MKLLINIAIIAVLCVCATASYAENQLASLQFTNANYSPEDVGMNMVVTFKFYDRPMTIVKTIPSTKTILFSSDELKAIDGAHGFIQLAESYTRPDGRVIEGKSVTCKENILFIGEMKIKGEIISRWFKPVQWVCTL